MPPLKLSLLNLSLCDNDSRSVSISLACLTCVLPLFEDAPGGSFTRVGEISTMDSKYPFSMPAASFGVPIVNCSLIAHSFLPQNVNQTCKFSDTHYDTNRAFRMGQTTLNCTCGISVYPVHKQDAGMQCFFTIESCDAPGNDKILTF